MKTRAYVHSSKVVSAWALENVDLKRVISAAVSIATLVWHDLEPNMQDKQFLDRAYGKSNSLFLGAVHMNRASPANRADSILSPLMGA